MRFKLPSHLPAGLYHVDYSDDGQHWSSVEDQTLQVVDQPSQAEVLELDSPAYGKCKPDDDADDTPCLIRALHAAQSTGATVHLGRGIWDFSGVVIHNECIVVPGNVSMTGEADGSSTVNYHPASDASHRALLCLSGNNHLQHLRFTQTATTSAAQPHAFVQLGTVDAHSVPETVSNIVVSRNDFTNSNAAIIDSGHALRNLTIVNNLFSIDGTALNLNGNRYMVSTTFLIADTTITQNVFMPPEHAPLDPQHGPIAAELGASLRMNFSRNRVTVNSANHYGKQGWRAGFFWSMNGNNTNLLIAENSVECSGAGGDGEAIALDSNANTYGYAGLQSVIAADNRSISVAAVPNDRQNGQRVDVNNYYTGHWLQIVSGTGIGQSRQIVGYQLDRVHQSARYFVQPAFSVIPSSEDSRIIITRLFNNAMILGNTIDNRNSQCSHHSRTRNQDINAGSISLWAPSVGTIIAHNVQYQTNGIMVQHTYSVPAQGCRQCENSVIRQQSLEIVGNNISGTFHIPGICAKTGIHLRVGAAPTPDHLPPLLNLGTRISQNQIQASQSDLLDGGIGVPLVWYYGPAQFHGSLLLGVIIEDNRIAGMENSTDSDSCPIKKYSVGINLSIPHATNYSHLHDNQCNGLRKTLVDHGSNTKRICYGNHVSCECR
ncbi:MAG TPA: hypothetical protein VG962_04230 [Steroidobacteraceae bacterium]|nr:hypothetical protein [Steroidobacteraceae bacterium]